MVDRTESYCVCKFPYIGAQPFGEPTRCERCGNLVDTSDRPVNDEERAALQRLAEQNLVFGKVPETEGDFLPEDSEPEFSEDQTEAAEADMERNRRVLALEIASSLGHLFKNSDEFWDFTEDVVKYLK